MHVSKDDAGEFDFVVVGAGSAGCAVAARLSESGVPSAQAPVIFAGAFYLAGRRPNLR